MRASKPCRMQFTELGSNGIFAELAVADKLRSFLGTSPGGRVGCESFAFGREELKLVFPA